jgi:signal recognition particle GTPase
LKPLVDKLGIPKLNFQVLRRTMATQAQNMGSVKDIPAHLPHAKADTTANECMQALPESVQGMVGSMYLMLEKEKTKKIILTICNKMQQRLGFDLPLSC